MTSQQRLIGRYIKDLGQGRLSWIGLRTERKGHIDVVNTTMAVEGLGLEGDHRMLKTPGSARQVSIISAEFITQIEHYSGHPSIDPGALRRNLVLEGINLNAMRYQRFQIGDAVFEATALCHPCTRMDQAVGKGTVAAMLGHGGLCARVLKSGRVTVGDAVKVLQEKS
ncbi:MAG: MOSC domain-containing protein [Halioglobus sp.]